MKNKKCIAGLLVLTVWGTGLTGFGKMVDFPVVEAKTAEAKAGEAGNGEANNRGAGNGETTAEGSNTERGDTEGDRITATVPEQVQAPETYQGVPVIVPDVEAITIKRAEPMILEEEDIEHCLDIISEISDDQTMKPEETEGARDYITGTFEMDKCPYRYVVHPGYVVGDDRKKPQNPVLSEQNQGIEINWNAIGMGYFLDWSIIQQQGSGFVDTRTNTPVELKFAGEMKEAQKWADAFIKNAGFTEFQPAEWFATRIGMQNSEDEVAEILPVVFRYERLVDGIPITWVHEESYPVFEKAVDDAVPNGNGWDAERLEVYYTNQSFEFNHALPMSITNYSDEKLFLLPFEEIRQIYENIITEKYKDSGKVTLSKVQLGYMRIREDENKKKGLLIPVWDFFGTRGDGEDDTMGYSLLTIDACDGTIIERKQGY